MIEPLDSSHQSPEPVKRGDRSDNDSKEAPAFEDLRHSISLKIFYEREESWDHLGGASAFFGKAGNMIENRETCVDYYR